MNGGSRAGMLRLIQAVYARFKKQRHPHLCALVVEFDNRPYGGAVTTERVLRIEWLEDKGEIAHAQ